MKNFVGVKVNYAKDITGPVLEFLSIQLDTILMQARLPDDKLQEAKDRIKSEILNTLLSREEFESLVGILTYVLLPHCWSQAEPFFVVFSTRYLEPAAPLYS